jgi:hypothetical protein
MKRNKTFSVALMIAATSLVACQGESESVQPVLSAPQVADGKSVPANDGASPGKPMAPISMDYEIVGKPIVGAPVMINVNVRSGEGPVTVRYSITDTSALRFQQGQEERWQIDDSRSKQSQQIAVIPQREGRLYVNISAEVETPGGMMIRSMAIPIKVGTAPPAATINGELKEGPDGETVISMPAQESVPE